METPSHSLNHKRGAALGGYLAVLGFAGIYFALQLWILPAAGIPT